MLYMVKWVYTRRQRRFHEKAKAFALYLASDLYCIYMYMYVLLFREIQWSLHKKGPIVLIREKMTVYTLHYDL